MNTPPDEGPEAAPVPDAADGHWEPIFKPLKPFPIIHPGPFVGEGFRRMAEAVRVMDKFHRLTHRWVPARKETALARAPLAEPAPTAAPEPLAAPLGPAIPPAPKLLPTAAPEPLAVPLGSALPTVLTPTPTAAPEPSGGLAALCCPGFTPEQFDRLLVAMGAIEEPTRQTLIPPGKHGLARFPAAYHAAVDMCLLLPKPPAVWEPVFRQRYGVEMSRAVSEYGPNQANRRKFHREYDRAKEWLRRWLKREIL